MIKVQVQWLFISGYSGTDTSRLYISSSSKVEMDTYAESGEGAGVALWAANDITIKNLHASKELEADGSSEFYDTT